MSTVELKKEGSVFIATMVNGAQQNTFTEDVINDHHRVLDEIEKCTDNCSVVLTSNDPKFWSNGINLEWIMTQGGDYFAKFKDIIDGLIMRWALLPMPTVACLTGHTYAGGAILACGFDFRLMRKDRGFFCFPEVDIKIPFTPKMHEVISLIPNHQALADLALTGRRIGGEEAAALKVVDGSYEQPELWEKTMALAQMLAEKDRATYRSIKYGLKKNVLAMAEKR